LDESPVACRPDHQTADAPSWVQLMAAGVITVALVGPAIVGAKRLRALGGSGDSTSETPPYTGANEDDCPHDDRPDQEGESDLHFPDQSQH
jgi:hypothetical protein